MTYDDWKLRSDRDDAPQPDVWRCEECGHPKDYCDCRCCYPILPEPSGERRGRARP